MKHFFYAALVAGMISLAQPAQAGELAVGERAPVFTATTHEGKELSLASRKGKWTVLFFYPKADTPGCTKQACSFRDSIGKVRALGAEAFGISADTVEANARFHAKHRLGFPLLSDPDSKVIRDYGAAMPVVGLAKRWTFILDPELVIRHIDRDVDPARDVEKAVAVLSRLTSSIR